MMIKTELFQDLADLIYPTACAACQQPLLSREEILCTYCLSELPRTNFHLQPENEVTRNFVGRCKLEKASAYLYYAKGGIVQQLMHSFKYRGIKEVGNFLGQMMGRDLANTEFFDTIDYLLPVPLHAKKFAQRGFNQSEVLAEGISEKAGIPVSTGKLVRQNFSETQTRKSRFARWKNVETIFAVKDPAALEGRHLMLIDDVITTGSTIEASATQLAAIPGVRVSLLTLAMAKN